MKKLHIRHQQSVADPLLQPPFTTTTTAIQPPVTITSTFATVTAFVSNNVVMYIVSAVAAVVAMVAVVTVRHLAC